MKSLEEYRKQVKENYNQTGKEDFFLPIPSLQNYHLQTPIKVEIECPECKNSLIDISPGNVCLSCPVSKWLDCRPCKKRYLITVD